MTLKQLEYAIAVENYRSFGKAANAIHVTQPTLSMQIKKLEEEFDILLFDRSKKPLIPTGMGEEFLRQARNILREKGKLTELVEVNKGVIKGELKMGIIPTLSPYLLPLFITRFMDENPEVKLVVKELETKEILDEMKKESIDLGILVTPLEEKGFEEIPLFYELFVAYVSKNHPLVDKESLSYNDLSTRDLWLLEEGHCFRNQMINICRDYIDEEKGSLKFESGSLETLKRMIDRHDGYTLLPELAVLDFSPDDYERVRHFQNPKPIREVSLVVRRKFVKKKLVERLMESIDHSIPDILKNKDRGQLIHWG